MMGATAVLDRPTKSNMADGKRNSITLESTYSAKQDAPKPSRSVRFASRWKPISKVLTIAFVLRLLIAFGGYSGHGKPPNYGDFEAQRHWMEITTELPVSQWYFHDPEWWKLDYPPLTAYHSWIFGKVGTMLNSSWFELYSSRGCEEIGLKAFMRSSVFVSELVLYIPAVVFGARQIGFYAGKDSPRYIHAALVALLLQPAIILVDHGHFQYNTVMLGFFMAAVSSFLADFHLLGCVFFVAALGFKQMALFYAPAVAAYLAGTCFVPVIRPFRLLAIAIVTILSFAMLYAPILLGTWDEFTRERLHGVSMESSSQLSSILMAQIAQSLHRIFPFARGLFEDKVANIWCTIHFSGVYKLAAHHSAETLSLVALGSTLLLILPPCLTIFLRPRKHLMLLAFTTCAWGFFLCSYQVHEKNVLLPLVPMTALLAGKHGEKAATRAWVGFANIVATWTLYHLLIKDELQLACWPVLGVWLYAMGLPPFSFEAYRVSSERGGLSQITRCVHFAAYAGIVAWHVVEHFVPPPSSKPDLWIVLNMICGCMAFCCCYLWCLWTLVADSGLIEDARVLVKSCVQERFSYSSVLSGRAVVDTLNRACLESVYSQAALAE